jgi:hypothetical protein
MNDTLHSTSLNMQFVEHEQFWLDLASHLHPRQFADILRKCSANALDAFSRVKGEVIYRLFEKVIIFSRDQPKAYFEFLMNEGYVPELAPNRACTGYYESHLGPWRIPNSTVMRTFWQDVLQAASPKWSVHLEVKLKAVVALLPSHSHYTCAECGWNVPITDMYDKTHCDFCVFTQQYKSVTLQRHRGHTFLKLLPKK